MHQQRHFGRSAGSGSDSLEGDVIMHGVKIHVIIDAGRELASEAREASCLVLLAKLSTDFVQTHLKDLVENMKYPVKVARPAITPA